jgi:hypothetical protein
MAQHFDTPQQRIRRILPREALFTASMAGREVQRRFLIQKRIAFTLAVLLGLAAMWILALQSGGQRLLLRWPLFGGAGCFFLLNAVTRRWLQTAAFYLAFITLGGALGTLGPPGNTLLNPTILVGLTALGASINTVVFRKERTRFAEFLWCAPWLLAGCVAVFFMPAGELVLLASGAAAILLMLVLFLSAEVALQVFQPSEHIFAAADVLPIVFLLAWRGWSGQN